MIKGLDLTVYELLGYLLPGVTASIGLLLVAACLDPQLVTLDRWSHLGWWILLPLAVAYVVGHLVQATANRLYDTAAEDDGIAAVIAQLPDDGFDAVARRLSFLNSAAAEIAKWKNGSKRAFLAICTELLDQVGKTTMRDVFLYREGDLPGFFGPVDPREQPLRSGSSLSSASL